MNLYLLLLSTGSKISVLLFSVCIWAFSYEWHGQMYFWQLFVLVLCSVSLSLPIYNPKVKAWSPPPPNVHFCLGTNSPFTLLLLMSLGFHWHFETSVPHFWILVKLEFVHELWHYQKYLSLLCYEVCLTLYWWSVYKLVLIELKALCLCYCMQDSYHWL